MESAIIFYNRIDALIKVHVFTGQIVIDPKIGPVPIDNFYYTFSNSNVLGDNYSITPLDPTRPSNGAKQYIRWMEISATGAEKKEINFWGWKDINQVPFNGDPPKIIQADVSLQKISSFESEVKNQMINSANSPKVFQNQLSLTASASNTIASGGVAELKAFNEVHIVDEFHAEEGSEVHIYNTILYPDCNPTIMNFRKAELILKNHEETSIEVNFKKPPLYFSIYPNPNAGEFKVSCNCNRDADKEVKVYDAVGKLILNQRQKANSFEIILNDIDKGVYYLEVNDQNKIFQQKIVIQ